VPRLPPARGASAEKPAPPVLPPASRGRTTSPGAIVPKSPLKAPAPVTGVPATPAVPAPSAAELFKLAVYHHRAGDFDHAETYYRALLQRNELDPQVHNNLGLLYRDTGMLDEAVREFQRALIINPEYLTARNNLGVAFLGQVRLDEASAEFRRVLGQDPRNVDASVNLALVEKAAGRPERAKESLLRALVLDPRNAPAHFNLASLYEQTGETVRALAHYRAFLEYAGPEHASRAPDARARIDALARLR
jgi:tetratricopeptide (TPR) repeat protein